MLVNSVIIVLHEVLEAALMISVLMAITRRLELRLRWLATALFLGFAGALAYARLLAPVSNLFDGVGQELVNAALQISVFAFLVIIAFHVTSGRGRQLGRGSWLPFIMALAVALSIVREGSEIIIYVSGFLQVESLSQSVTVGSLTGAGIGCSVGVLLYYLLLAIPEARATWVSLLLLCLAASSMVAQATKLLIQADWLTVAGPLWDTSRFISEQSMPGELLYALIGYEASPSAIEVAVYVGSILIMFSSAAVGWLTSNRSQAAAS